MNSAISDISLDLGPFALDFELESARTDCALTRHFESLLGPVGLEKGPA